MTRSARRAPGPWAAAAGGVPRRRRLRAAVRGRDIRCLPGRSRLPPPGGSRAHWWRWRATRAGGRIAAATPTTTVGRRPPTRATHRILQHHADRWSAAGWDEAPGLFLDAASRRSRSRPTRPSRRVRRGGAGSATRPTAAAAGGRARTARWVEPAEAAALAASVAQPPDAGRGEPRPDRRAARRRHRARRLRAAPGAHATLAPRFGSPVRPRRSEAGSAPHPAARRASRAAH